MALVTNLQLYLKRMHRYGEVPTSGSGGADGVEHVFGASRFLKRGK